MRDIEITGVTPYGTSVSTELAHSIREHSTMDVAEIIPQGAEGLNDGLQVSMSPIKTNDVVIVVTWQTDRPRPVPEEVRVMPREGDDGALLRLNKAFYEGDSGSPVFNSRGALIAIIAAKSLSTQAGSSTLAIPLSEFRDWLTPAVEAESEAARKERERLAQMFDQVVTKMREAQQTNDESVFPAFKRYKENPSQEAWSTLVYAVKQSLGPIEEGIKLSREYDAQVAPLSDEVAVELQNVQSYAINRTYSRKFTEAREVWNGRALEMQQITRQELGPSLEEAEKWERDLKNDYARLANLLSAISRQLIARTGN